MNEREAAAEGGSASEEVAAAFANRESNMRSLVARVAGVDPEIARRLGYGLGSKGAGDESTREG